MRVVEDAEIRISRNHEEDSLQRLQEAGHDKSDAKIVHLR